MTEKQHPWLIAQELENQVWRPGKLEEDNREIAPKVNTRVNDLIRKIIPEDPYPTPAERIQADITGDEIYIKFTFGHIEGQKNPHSRPGDEIDLIIKRGLYPRKYQAIPEPTILKLGSNMYLISDEMVMLNEEFMRIGDIKGHFMDMLDELEAGFESGKYTPVIYRRDKDVSSETVGQMIPAYCPLPRFIYGPFPDEAE